VQPSASSNESNIQLASEDLVPQDARLMFSVRAQTPSIFARDEKIEVATADESYSSVLGTANGGITLGDSKVAVVTLDPAKAFGPSAFGPLRFRVIANGVSGDWQPLGTLVRLPVLRELKCPATPELACKLSGSNLFLVDSVSGTPQFAHPVQVPDGFPGYSMPVPHPTDGQLYVKLRDDPSVINQAALSTQQLPPTPEEIARAPGRHVAARSDVDSAGTAAGEHPAPTSDSPSPASGASPPTTAQPTSAPQAPQTQPQG